MTLDELIKLNKEYIADMRVKADSHPLFMQYLKKSEFLLLHLENIKTGIPFPKSLLWTLLDDFDIDSKFYSGLSHFMEENKDKISD
jgi:hypothetical protein